MSREVPLGGALPRLARLLLVRNELRRPSDRIEGAILVTLAAAFLAAAVVAGFLAAHVYRSQRLAAQGLRPVVAVVSASGPIDTTAFPPATGVQARWRLPDGAERSGVLTPWVAPAIFDAIPGTDVQIWLNRAGQPQPPPPGQRVAILDALITGVVVTTAAAVLLMLGYQLCRMALDRHRLATWASAWAATGPRWTSRQLIQMKQGTELVLPGRRSAHLGERD